VRSAAAGVRPRRTKQTKAEKVVNAAAPYAPPHSEVHGARLPEHAPGHVVTVLYGCAWKGTLYL
jgi:hypothetical protein